ncbi:MAG TPA: transposase family protein [Micromonosporaceae bacterium]|nr:transposase family protein [Micromonosporaceae bacterium]
MYHTTGFTRDQITDLCVLVRQAAHDEGTRFWPPILGLFTSVAVVLTHLRRNRVQDELAEAFGVSQPTISRAVTRLTSVLGTVLADHVPTAEDLDETTQHVVDGTLLPCWSWASHRELYSGKHKKTGMNIQVACTTSGQLAWISDPVEGSRHDTHCLHQSGVLATHDPANWIGDKGYIGNGMLTPIRKPAHRELLDWEKEFNQQINRIRSIIERIIADLKTWRILHTDYRRPFATFAQTISTVIALRFYQLR